MHTLEVSLAPFLRRRVFIHSEPDFPPFFKSCFFPLFKILFFLPWFKANCESRPMVLKVTFCTGAIKSSNLCWWTWVIISVKICLASACYKLFKHHRYALVICGLLMAALKSSAANSASPAISQTCENPSLNLIDDFSSLPLVLSGCLVHEQRAGALVMFIIV